MKKILPVSLAIVTSLVFGNTVYAQTASPAISVSPKTETQTVDLVSLIVSPPTYNFEIKPGETVQKNIKITNPSKDRELVLEASVSDFIVNDNQGTPIKVEENASGRYLASTWFTLEKNELVIPAGQTVTTVVVISAPQDALPGGHYAGVYFTPKLDKGAKNTVSYTAMQVGSLFELTVAGNIKYDAVIKDFNTKKNFYEFGPVEFSASIENQSDTHIHPTSSVTIRDMFGRKLDSIAMSEYNIFPFTSREISGKWENIWGLGRYTATLTASYASGMTAERTIFFWLMPWKLIAAIMVVLASLLVFVISVRRHLKHRMDKRDNEIDELKRRIVELENTK